MFGWSYSKNKLILHSLHNTLKMPPTRPSPIIIFHPSLIRSNLPQCKPHLWSGVSVFGKERWAKGDLLFLFLPPKEKRRKEGPPDSRLTKLRDNRKAVFSCLSETADSSYEYQGGSIRIAYRYLSPVREANVSADMEAILLFRRNLQQRQSRYLFKTVTSFFLVTSQSCLGFFANTGCSLN